MVGMKVVVRILCAVALLVQCATCHLTPEEAAALRAKHVAAVIEVLASYIEIIPKPNRAHEINGSKTSVASHISMLKESNAFELNFKNLDNQLNFERFGVGSGYCPTTTMLACGEADVPVEFCLALLHKANALVQTSREHFGLLSTVEVNVKPEPKSHSKKSRYVKPTEAKGWQPGQYPSGKPNTLPIASSRKRSASSIERKQKVIAERKLMADVKELLENRPPPQRDMLVEERLKVLEIQVEDWASKEDDSNKALNCLTEKKEALMNKKEALTKRQEELTKRQEALTEQQEELTLQHEELERSEEDWMELQDFWSKKLTKLTEEKNKCLKERKHLQQYHDKQDELVVDEEQARSLQIQRSIDVSTALAQFPYEFNAENEEPSKKWINASVETDNFADIATNCYPERFIVCGQHAKNVAPEKRSAAVLECIDTIRKYNGFRRMALPYLV